MRERATYDEALARRGLIVPELVVHVEPDVLDPDGWYERLEVTDMGSEHPRTLRGAWHGRVVERTELVWWWRDHEGPAARPERGYPRRRWPRPHLGPAIRDLFGGAR